ncbi:MAG: geranylgeranylglycerol-phosphate geranylgeranyltransferase [Cytophagaceae bacterium]|nr:geranylgeranylglycerol-phosphate geranylgeranyltransferase [Cytophagaceae bacterium]
MRPPRPKPSAGQILAGFFRLVRWPNLVLLALAQYLVRLSLISPEQRWYEGIFEGELFRIVLSTACIAAAGYIINDYYDIKIDLINKPERVVIGRYIKRRWAMGINLVLNGMGVLLGLTVDRRVALINVIAVVMLWLYSNYLKRQPFWGNFVVSALTALSLIVLAVHYRRHQELVYLYALFSFCLSLVREIIKDMEDVKGDATFGCQTLPIIWGLRRTKTLLYVILALFFLILAGSLRVLPATMIYFFAGMSLPMSYLVYRLVLADTRRDFAFLSQFCKGIMVLGILTMGWV